MVGIIFPIPAEIKRSSVALSVGHFYDSNRHFDFLTRSSLHFDILIACTLKRLEKMSYRRGFSKLTAYRCNILRESTQSLLFNIN